MREPRNGDIVIITDRENDHYLDWGRIVHTSSATYRVALADYARNTLDLYPDQFHVSIPVNDK